MRLFRVLLGGLLYGGMMLVASEEQTGSEPGHDFTIGFGDYAIDLDMEVHRPGEAQAEWREDVSSEGGYGEEVWRGESQDEAGRGFEDQTADGSQSWLYCLDENGEPNLECLGFAAAVTNSSTGESCVLVQDPVGPGAPQCLDDVPEPDVEQALVEEPVAETESDWEQILVQIPGEVERTFASLPIDGGQVSFEPELLGFGYVNRHTNVFVDTESQTFTETLLGIEVEVRAIPVEHRFDYGDGTVRTLHEPGGPGAQLGTTEDADTLADMETSTSHVYQETGVYPVGVTTTFIGEYRLPGGTWTPVNGSAEVPAAPGEADIWRIDHRHVADQCRETDHWGCSGPVELGPGDQPPAVFADQYDESGRYLGP